jgi:hypothetical protein
MRRMIGRCALFTMSVLLLMFTCFAGHAEAAQMIGGDLIVINKKTNELAFFRDGLLERKFSVATGKTEDLTPEGTFKIVNKIKNRPYYKLKIPGGDPKNPLGDRWMGLEVNGTYGTTYGIHGNHNEKSIGKYVSAGCIRMHNKEIHWLFEEVKLKTTVVITSTDLSFEEVAAKHNYPLYTALEGKLSVNGVDAQLPQSGKMFMYRDTIFVPLRGILEALGGVVLWDQATRTVSATVGDYELSHVLTTKELVVNGAQMELRKESFAIDGTTYVPVRDIAQMSGYYVEWDGKEKAVILSSN